MPIWKPYRHRFVGTRIPCLRFLQHLAFASHSGWVVIDDAIQDLNSSPESITSRERSGSIGSTTAVVGLDSPDIDGDPAGNGLPGDEQSH